ncbi:DASH family cryptochrome [Leeuwenhoekiella sp. MAR_2009_132]|uniref:DASH family cryptochrome n=1 Tax=Leeuwenhoekiella sp. MAR_2009_132 TaxID=1392489 RepID=UPI00048FA9B2|nr:DASH family cryptochrome [Leeuwenhoekiella sp. MAR_2009_132]
MNLVWFKNDLRTIDHTGLSLASKTKNPTIAVYCFDPKQFKKDRFGFKKTEKYRAQFLIETVTELRENLEKLNITLFVVNEEPEFAIPKLVKNYQVERIYFQKEWTFEERNIIEGVRVNCPNGTSLIETFDQFLWHPEDLPYSNYSEIPKVFTNFRKYCEKQVDVRPIVNKIDAFPNENLISQSTQIPSLHDLGLSDFEIDKRTAFPFKGGENQANLRIEEYFWETKNLQYYKKTRNGLVGKDYSSKLSAWLANGSISARMIYWEVQKFEKDVIKNDSTYWLIFELIWRDFFKYVSLKHGDRIFKIGGILNADYDWDSNEHTRKNWINGTTKYDFVNANMLELSNTGWMSNRGRQNVASFWAKESKQDWRIGAAYFESLLIDYDVHSNYGNWIYNSGVGNDPRDRIFNIKSQAERYDESGTFTRLWLQNSLFD